MTIEAVTNEGGWTDVKVDRELLEKSGILWYLNQSLHGQRMRVYYNLDAKGNPQLYLAVLSEPAGPTFEYTQDADTTHSKQWSEFLREVRP